jgi:cellulose 1,4-beta-cellobiosidase
MMARARTAAALCLLRAASGQQAGSATKEEHPALTVYSCSATEMCAPERGAVTLDAQYRWLHAADGSEEKGCMREGNWDKTLCSDPKKCAQNCAIEGVNAHGYKNTYGVHRVDNGLQLELTEGGGSRIHLTDALSSYKVFSLKNRELSFDVDVSSLPCGVTSSIILTTMDSEGDKGMGGNTAGADYGLGGCDANCNRGVKFSRGQANLEGWDAESGTGSRGVCCPELRLWDANKEAASMSMHPCAGAEPQRCEGDECERMCDSAGCRFDHAELGVAGFFGKGAEVDTTKPITVVTQFITSDGTDTGLLSEVRRYYVQNGQVVSNAAAAADKFPSLAGKSSFSDEFCSAQKEVQGASSAAGVGYMRRLSEALDNGVVLTASLQEAELRGCAGAPERPDADAAPSVVFSNIMYGEITSTCPECEKSAGAHKRRSRSWQNVASTSPAAPQVGPKPFVQQPMFKYIMGGAGLLAASLLLSTCCGSSSKSSAGWGVQGSNAPARRRVY